MSMIVRLFLKGLNTRHKLDKVSTNLGMFSLQVLCLVNVNVTVKNRCDIFLINANRLLLTNHNFLYQKADRTQVTIFLKTE